MSMATTITLVLHFIVTIALIIIVLLQSSNQSGMSGAIAGGAETFFGKNKGRTIDGILKKLTAVVAVIFIITSVALSLFLTK